MPRIVEPDQQSVAIEGLESDGEEMSKRFVHIKGSVEQVIGELAPHEPPESDKEGKELALS